MCIKKECLQSFLKDDNDGILRKTVGKLFLSMHPLNEKNVLNTSDLTVGTMALADP